MSLYNDDGDEQEVTFYASVAADMTQNCPNGCSGNGQCLLGHCQCNPGFGGDDCSESKCISFGKNSLVCRVFIFRSIVRQRT